MANANKIVSIPASGGEDGLNRYLSEIKKFPILAPEEEFMLAKRWREQGDTDAAARLVNSHLRLVAKIAMGYRGYGLPVSELISEGNIGLMQGVKKFEPDRGFRLATYAMWWIRASIQEFILRSWSLVKIGTTAAQTIARYFALQWHHEGLAPYIVFQGRRDHGDAVVGDAQAWLATRFSVAAPVEEMVKRSGIPERTFKRRFKEETGFAPIDYVQRLRIEDAKRRLERTDASADEISWKVGYEDPAFFRRLFKRVTGITPGAYRSVAARPDPAQDPAIVQK